MVAHTSTLRTSSNQSTLQTSLLSCSGQLHFATQLLSAVAMTVLFSASSLSFCDNSRTAALSFMKFCTNMYLDNLKTSLEFEGHRSKVKVTGPDFRILHHCEIGPCCYWLLLCRTSYWPTLTSLL